jgi:hypothetical protein
MCNFFPTRRRRVPRQPYYLQLEALLALLEGAPNRRETFLRTGLLARLPPSSKRSQLQQIANFINARTDNRGDLPIYNISQSETTDLVKQVKQLCSVHREDGFKKFFGIPPRSAYYFSCFFNDQSHFEIIKPSRFTALRLR